MDHEVKFLFRWKPKHSQSKIEKDLCTQVNIKKNSDFLEKISYLEIQTKKTDAL